MIHEITPFLPHQYHSVQDVPCLLLELQQALQPIQLITPASEPWHRFCRKILNSSLLPALGASFFFSSNVEAALRLKSHKAKPAG